MAATSLIPATSLTRPWTQTAEPPKTIYGQPSQTWTPTYQNPQQIEDQVQRRALELARTWGHTALPPTMYHQQMMPVNYVMPSYLTAPEDPNVSFWGALWRSLFRSIGKALGHSIANFFDSTPLSRGEKK